ncbi:MAG: DUF6457 domain-containing protein [Euzebya sp.]
MDVDDAELAQLVAQLDLVELTAEECTAVLDLTRVVAHSGQRKFGPITAYALGLSLGADTDPTDRLTRLQRAIATITDRSAATDSR